MAFTVYYFKSGGSIAAERWIGKLSLAEAVAKKAVADGIAERVEILNEAGVLVFEYPKVRQSA